MATAQSLLLQAFEKTLAQWMEQFHALLTYDNAALAEPSPDAESALDAVKAAVCQNINLLIGRDEEEFEPFLERFVHAVWTQLVSVTLKPGQVRCSLAAGQACQARGCPSSLPARGIGLTLAGARWHACL